MWVVCLGLAFIVGFGCSSSVKKPAVVDVKGTVNLNGKPLSEGEIAFDKSGEVPQVAPIKEGAFSGKGFVGENRVEIRAFKVGPPLSTDPTNTPTKVNFLSDKYQGPNSTLKATVPAGGANDLKFEVTSP